MAEHTLDTSSSSTGNVRLVLDVDSVETSSSGATAAYSSAAIYLKDGYSVSDSSNSLACSGNGVADSTTSNISIDKSTGGSQKLKTLSPSNVSLAFGSTTEVTVKVTLTGVDYLGTLSGTYTRDFPRRPYSAPDAPSVSVTESRITLSGHQTSSSKDKYWANLDWQKQRDEDSWSVITSGGSGSIETKDWTTAASNSRWRARARAYNQDATGSWGYSGYVYTTPTTANNLSASRASNGDVTVKWSNRGQWLAGNRVQRSVNGGGWSTIATVSASATSYTDSTLATSASAEYRIVAYTPSGETGSESSTSGTVSVEAAYSTPSAPTGVVASISGTSFTSKWGGNVNTSSNVKYWENVLWRLLTDDSTGSTQTLGGTSTTDTRTVPANKKLRFQVASRNDAGQSSWVTSNTVYSPQSTPKPLIARSMDGTKVRVSGTFAPWAASVIVEQATAAAGPWKAVASGSPDGAISVPVPVEQTLYFRVYTTDPNGGTSARSAATQLVATLPTDTSGIPGVAKIYFGTERVRQVFSNKTRIWVDGTQ